MQSFQQGKQEHVEESLYWSMLHNIRQYNLHQESEISLGHAGQTSIAALWAGCGSGGILFNNQEVHAMHPIYYTEYTSPLWYYQYNMCTGLIN